MKRAATWLVCLLLVGLSVVPTVSLAQTEVPVDSPPLVAPTNDEFYKAKVVRIITSEQVPDLGVQGAQPYTQVAVVKLLEGPQADQEIEVRYGAFKADQQLQAGERVILIKPGSETDDYYVFDKDRTRPLYVILGFFVLITLALARWRGVTSLLGLGVSIAILSFYMVPKIMAGSNPLIVCMIGALIIATISLYLAHGFTKRTTVAYVSTLITIVFTIGLAVLFVNMAKLLGMGSEEAFYLQVSPGQQINLKGLLLGGIIIGALGVLDDITTGQAAAVDEISKANPSLSSAELIRRGFSVGREHITSLVNTLVLAYAGASFPSLLLFTAYERPWWVVMNTELIAEEIIRTLVGSIALIAAVPITTFIAAYWLKAKHESGTPRQPVIQADTYTSVSSHRH